MHKAYGTLQKTKYISNSTKKALSNSSYQRENAHDSQYPTHANQLKLLACRSRILSRTEKKNGQGTYGSRKW